jgi:flagellar motor switch protein FliN
MWAIMMDDGLLSQEDIDALTAGLLGGFDGGNSDKDNGDLLDPESLRPLMKLLCDQASSVVTTVLSKNVDFKILNIELCSAHSIDSSLLSNQLWIKVNVSKDMDGTFSTIMGKEICATLADLMMMGDGNVPFDEEHKDAMAELMNQVSGSLGTAMTEQYRSALSLGQAEIQLTSDDQDISALGGVVGKISLKIEEVSDTIIFFVFDRVLVDSFLAFTNKGSRESEIKVKANESVSSSSVKVEESDLNTEPELDYSSNSGRCGGGLFESSGNRVLDMLLDIPLNLTIELGRTQMSIRRVLEMGPGSIIELDRFSGEPVDLLVNNKVVAKGEVVVVDENFGIRIVSLVTPEERIKFLR